MSGSVTEVAANNKRRPRHLSLVDVAHHGAWNGFFSYSLNHIKGLSFC